MYKSRNGTRSASGGPRFETLRIGGLTLEFLHSKDDTDGTLDLFKRPFEPGAKVPAPPLPRELGRGGLRPAPAA